MDNRILFKKRYMRRKFERFHYGSYHCVSYRRIDDAFGQSRLWIFGRLLAADQHGDNSFWSGSYISAGLNI